MSNIYHVTDARHRIPVIAVAIDADVIRLYGLNPIGTDSQGKTIITKDTLLNDTSYEYYGEVVWSDELNQYCEITLSKSILRSDTTFNICGLLNRGKIRFYILTSSCILSRI